MRRLHAAAPSSTRASTCGTGAGTGAGTFTATRTRRMGVQERPQRVDAVPAIRRERHRGGDRRGAH